MITDPKNPEVPPTPELPEFVPFPLEPENPHMPEIIPEADPQPLTFPKETPPGHFSKI
jgi:hypothetical protein